MTATPPARAATSALYPRVLALLCLLSGVLPAVLPGVLPDVLSGLLPAAHAAEPNPQVKVRRAKGKMLLDVTMTVPVRMPLAFEVLSDYNHMASFVPGIVSSKITHSHGNRLQVTQHGKTVGGVMSFAWDSVRDVTLNPPHDISSRVTGGTVKSGESTTRFIQEENQTRIIVHSESTASLLFPPLIGPAFVEGQVRRQYNDFREEMLKRQKAQAKANPAAHKASASASAHASAHSSAHHPSASASHASHASSPTHPKH